MENMVYELGNQNCLYAWLIILTEVLNNEGSMYCLNSKGAYTVQLFIYVRINESLSERIN